MILPFSQQHNGKPTRFAEKIWANQSLWTQEEKSLFLSGLVGNKPALCSWFLKDFDPCFEEYPPKMHTIREDKNNRWKPGMLIHAVYNNRTKN